MPSGWSVYYVVFLSALLALGIPAVLGLASRIVSVRRGQGRAGPPNSRGGNAQPSEETGVERIRTRRVNTRYFLAANAALMLLVLGFLMVPSVVVLGSGRGTEPVLKGLVTILSVTGFSALGLLYSARKGDLSWLRSFQRGRAP